VANASVLDIHTFVQAIDESPGSNADVLVKAAVLARENGHTEGAKHCAQHPRKEDLK
jgi:hypothetical protein